MSVAPHLDVLLYFSFAIHNAQKKRLFNSEFPSSLITPSTHDLKVLFHISLTSDVCRLDEPMMVVSKDGGLHALDPVSKKKRWSFSSGEALCSTYSSHFADIQEQGNDHLTTRECNGSSMDHGGGRTSENDDDEEEDDPDLSAESCSIEDADLSGGHHDHDNDDVGSRDGGASAESSRYSSIFLGPNGALYVEDVSGVNVGTFFHKIQFCC
jgi:hypothetical protein